MIQTNEKLAVTLASMISDEMTEAPNVLHIGNTVYEVHTHFNPQGRLSVLEQFQKLLLANNNLN